MEFKKPESLKRYSDERCSSPYNRKKTKLLSTTISTPETRTNKIDPFDDNFSQFFRSQFIRQISDAETSTIQKAESVTDTSVCEYNFSEIDGFSQYLNGTQFETSITSGQRCTANESIDEKRIEAQTVENENWQFASQFEDENQQVNGDQSTDAHEPIEYKNEFEENAPEKCDSDRECQDDCELNKENDEDADSEYVIQSSQAFFKELSTVHLNISTIVNETINANKICTQDFLDPAQYQVYKSNVTESQYIHLKRPTPTQISNCGIEGSLKDGNDFAADKSVPSKEINTEMFEDQLLAEIVLTTQALAKNTDLLENQLLATTDEIEELDISEKLNECIDPDSSALEIFSDGDDKENDRNFQVGFETPKDTKHQPKNVPNSTIAAIKQTETLHHSPVTAANYCSMGPFFGLPLKVKKLIKKFKNIDDLYGEHPLITFKKKKIISRKFGENF